MRAPALLSLILSFASAAACQKEGAPKAGPAGKSSGPTLEIYVMSQCPYGVDVVNAIAATHKQLGGAFNLDMQFIGDGTAGKLESMHGPSEVKGNLAQVCARQQAPDRYLDMIVCQNEDPRAVDTNWRECGGKVGMDVEALAACIEGDEGQKLLAASFDAARKRGATGSPTMFLDGAPYEGGRKPRDFMRSICAATKGDKPAACGQIPEPPRVEAIFLSDTRCKACDIRMLEPRLKSVFGGLVVKHVDYGSAEGKELYQKVAAHGVKHLPTVLFAPEVEKDGDGFAEVKQFLRPVGDYRELLIGGEFDPTAEICDNSADDNGDGKSDCQDATCAQALTCRPAKEKQLDLFVMSQCPYGAQAMVAAKEFTDHMGKEVTLNVHFIGDVRGDVLTSMHGQAEVDEDVRERCAIARYGKDHQFMKYLACRSRDYQNPAWQPCAVEAGMNPAAIQGCFDGEGKKLLAESFAMSKSMKMEASPTFLVNNKRTFNAIAASEIQNQYCKDNPGLARCKDFIPPPDPGSAAGQAAAGGQCN